MLESEAAVRVFIPAHQVDQVEQLLSLKRGGFVPPVSFSADRNGYELSIDGDEVLHFLELIEIATLSRHAETLDDWHHSRSKQLDLLGD